jgi:hypothetical protein
MRRRKETTTEFGIGTHRDPRVAITLAKRDANKNARGRRRVSVEVRDNNYNPGTRLHHVTVVAKYRSS